ncbi:probable flavin-containing monooxygenase 1 [Brachypodium distachyon]|uniref:probable flavin-containing monooxygenase 1 n=1 Tax=Brachypodium distachyon TaxID=15368 RepID=UPI0001C7683A|nr:probable flavin-containing monooxygenase 1 [Brachypodium distachyon]|eukprot:XP_010229083.1 probable flavin-containing monooxygenase 1 [Brachypodium distachyon]
MAHHQQAAARSTRQWAPASSRVAIIGGGISGLAAARKLAAHDPVLFEATPSIGGVWKNCSYRTTRLQTPRPDYEFTDYSWSNRDDPSFPTHAEIVDYLEGYADAFGLWRYIMLGARVVGVRFLGAPDAAFTDLWSGSGKAQLDGKPMWEVGVETGTGDSATVQWYKFEFVVMCTGKYGDVPRMPVFPKGKGPEVFKGQVMHSLDYCKLSEPETVELMRGKKVVVVGFKKSAIDLANECAQANQGEGGQPCTMLVRTLHWVVPSYSIWGLPFFLFYSTRFSQLFYERPNQGFFRSLVCGLMSPLRAGVSKFIESYLSFKLPLGRYGLRPDHPFVEDYASCQMAILPEAFFDMADRGLVRFQRAPDGWCFSETGVVLDDGTRVDADLVFLATGFEGKDKLRSVLPDPFRSLLVNKESSMMPLYRGTIHPRIPNMAFVGYVESVSNLHTSELRCRWLAGLLEGRFALPSVGEMMAHVEDEAEAMKRTTRFYRRHCISVYSIHDSDGMCADLGSATLRKRNCFAELFAPYNNQDYKEQ